MTSPPAWDLRLEDPESYWDITIVEHIECAEVLRSIGVDAAAFTEKHWQDEVKGKRALLMDRCARFSGDLALLGVTEFWQAWTPPPFANVSEFIEERSKVAGYSMTSEETHDIVWRGVTDTAQRLEPETRTGRLEAVVDPGGNGRSAAFRVRDWEQLAIDPPAEWLVAGLIPRRGVAILAGAPSTGKTLLAADLALRASHGMDWLGRKVKKFSSLFFAGEGIAGSRVRAWQKTHQGSQQLPDQFCWIVDGVPNLADASGVPQIKELIESAIREHGKAPDMIVLDTLAVACPGGDENDAGVAGLLMRRLMDIAREYDCLILILHHLRKTQPNSKRGGADSIRGSSAIVGACDVAVVASKKGDICELRLEKARDAEMGLPVYYEIKGVDTGITLDDGRNEYGPVPMPSDGPSDDGDDMMSRVVKAIADLKKPETKTNVALKMKGRYQTKLDAIEAAIDAGIVSRDAGGLLRVVGNNSPSSQVPASSR